MPAAVQDQGRHVFGKHPGEIQVTTKISSWTAVEQDLLHKCRLDANIDETAFARRHNISLAQLRELENGLGAFFYSPKIKAQVGCRLLQELGVESIEFASDVSETCPVSTRIFIKPFSARQVIAWVRDRLT